MSRSHRPNLGPSGGRIAESLALLLPLRLALGGMFILAAYSRASAVKASGSQVPARIWARGFRMAWRGEW